MIEQIIVYGAVISAVYALIAIGFALMFSVAGILNLAHGAYYMLGAYAFGYLSTTAGMSLWISAVGSILFVGGVGWVVDRYLIDPHRGDQMAVLMVTFVLLLVLQQVVVVTFGADLFNIPNLMIGNVVIVGSNVSAQQIITVVGVVVALVVLYSFLHYTRFGVSVLALSQDVVGAEYVGIASRKVFSLIAAIAAGLAALAGLMAGPFLSADPYMGLPALVKAFAIVIVGGLGSLSGTVVAAILIGYAETIVSFLYSSAWSEVVSLGAVLLVLVFRPRGIFGYKIKT